MVRVRGKWSSVRRVQPGPLRRDFQVDARSRRRDNLLEGGMTALPNAMTTRNRFLTTVKALERALRQAEFDRPAADSAPFFSRDNRYLPGAQTTAFFSVKKGFRRGAVDAGFPLQYSDFPHGRA